MVAVGAIVAALIARYGLDLLVARGASAQAFGTYAVVVAYGATMAAVAALGFPELANGVVALQRRGRRSESIRAFDRFGTLMAVAAGMVLGSLVAVASAIGLLNVESDASLILVVLTPVGAVFLLKRQLALLSERVALGLFAPALVSGTAAFIVLTVAATRNGAIRAEFALGALTIGYLFVIGLLVISTGGHSTSGKVFRSPAPTRERRLTWMRQGLVVLASNIATTVTGQLDLLVIASFASAADVGVYAAATRLAFLLTLPLSAIVAREGPIFGRLLAEDQPAACWRQYRQAAAFSGAAGLALGVLLTIFGRTALSMFGNGFQQGWSWLMILGIGRLISAATGPVAVLLIAAGEARAAAVSSWLGLLVGILSIFALGSWQGASGVAVGAALGVSCQNLAQAAFARRAFVSAERLK